MRPTALEHVSVIAAQVRRLDEVVQGFLKFTRPEDLQLRPVAVLPLIEELMPVVSAEASKSGVERPRRGARHTAAGERRCRACCSRRS